MNSQTAISRGSRNPKKNPLARRRRNPLPAILLPPVKSRSKYNPDGTLVNPPALNPPT